MPVSVEIINSRGESAGSLEVSDALLGCPEKSSVVRTALDCFLANQRHGCASTRTRGEVSGSGVKPWKQKGTGRARAGSRRSPVWTGGGVVFGPKPRDFGYRINRKVRRQAIVSLLSSLQREKRLIVLDSAIVLPSPKTREVVALREQLGIQKGQKAFFLTEGVDMNLWRASRNLGTRSAFPTLVRPMNNLNVFDLLCCDFLVMTTGAIKALEETYQ